MYGDKLLEMRLRAETPAASTRAVCIGQGDLFDQAGDTRGVAPIEGLYLLVMAGEDVPANVVYTLETSDTEGGAYSALVSKKTAAATPIGQVVWKEPVPHNAKNWLRVTQTPLVPASPVYYKTDSILAHNPDKDLYGIWGVDG
jgi:hypothetical protein